MWQSEVKSSRVGKSAPKIDSYEKLSKIEGFIAKTILSKFDREPHPLTDLWTKDDFLERVKVNRNLKKLYGMQSFYTGALEEGLRIETDTSVGLSSSIDRAEKYHLDKFFSLSVCLKSVQKTELLTIGLQCKPRKF